MFNFKKRLISDYFNCEPSFDPNHLQDHPLDKQNPNCTDLEHLSNRHTSTDTQKNSDELNLDDQEQDVDEVSKIPKSTYQPPERKRTAENALGPNIDDILSNRNWKVIDGDNLKLKYCKLYTKKFADNIFKSLEEEVQYLEPENSKVQVFGKWHQIPRKHAAYGERGVTYTFSNATLPAKCWDACPTILGLKEVAEIASGETYNFVLINRYKDGNDYMGEHKDNESDLVAKSAISSFSFGQARDFLFKYDTKKLKDKNRSGIPSFKQVLDSGSLLIMEYPTNLYWYHCLPVRKNALGVRINLTFRNIVKRH